MSLIIKRTLILNLAMFTEVERVPRGSVLMEQPQNNWPFGNVKGPLVIKYLDCWQNTGGGLSQEPQLKCSFFLFSLFIGKNINNAHLEDLN